MRAEVTRLHLPFLGSRTYLQGTTILDGLLPLVPANASLVVNFPQLLFTDRLIVRSEQDSASPACVVLKWRRGDERGAFLIYPSEPSRDPVRIPYDEDSLVQLASFEADCVRLDTASPHSFAATIVSLQKALLHRVLPMSDPGRWLFVRLELSQVPKAFIPLELKLLQLASAKLARCEVRSSGEFTGILYFSWMPRP
jgi:hypothetical protein